MDSKSSACIACPYYKCLEICDNFPTTNKLWARVSGDGSVYFLHLLSYRVLKVVGKMLEKGSVVNAREILDITLVDLNVFLNLVAKYG